MKYIYIVFAIFCALKTNAQTYLITFTGTGATNTVSTVNVENLTKGTFLILNGNDILRLTGTTGVNSIENKQSSEIKIYPNPMIDNSTVEIFPSVAGDATITIYDMTGKPVTQIHSYLENYPQEFHLSGINYGFYLISVKGKTYRYTGKLLCNGAADRTIRIKKISFNQVDEEKSSKMDYKGAQAIVDMQYSTGDRLKFTGISGIYNTVKMDVPAGDKIITFNFIACSDGDNNNYPVIEIGTQVWMAENLRTTKYNNGTTIPLVIDAIEWTNLTAPGYCYYNNNEVVYKTTYGALYNWNTVSTNKLCPAGWHVPSDVEWTMLTTYLGGNSIASGKLKESGRAHWKSPNTGATNETGFTALPGGYRSGSSGSEVFYGIGNDGNWWSSTETSKDVTWLFRAMYYNNSSVSLGNSFSKNGGHSVRCLRD